MTTWYSFPGDVKPVDDGEYLVSDGKQWSVAKFNSNQQGGSWSASETYEALFWGEGHENIDAFCSLKFIPKFFAEKPKLPKPTENIKTNSSGTNQCALI